MTNSVSADAFIAEYQQIYFACHQRHVVVHGRVVSEQQLQVLSHLDLARATKVGELAAHLGLSHSSVSLTLERLARDGYVTRAPSATDGRVTLVRLTDAGEEVRSAQRVLEPDRVTSLFRRLTPAERRAAREGMALLARAAQEESSARRAAKRGAA